MGAVAVGAYRGGLRSGFRCMPMNAFLIREKGLCAFSIRLHQELLPMASSASGGNVGVVYRRTGFRGCKNLVRASMAVLAVCRQPTVFGRLGVQAVRVGILCIGMALRAGDLLRRCVVRQALHILVAIDAGEKIAVDGMLQLGFIHKKADLLAVHFRGQSGVGVAGQTVLIAQLVLSASRKGAGKQARKGCQGKDILGGFHNFEEILCWQQSQ